MIVDREQNRVAKRISLITKEKTIIMMPAILTQGYFLEYSKEAQPYQHRFCGPHEIVGAECPNCSKPLLRFLSFDTADPKLRELSEIAPQIHLLNCWTCNLAQRPFFYQCLADGSVKLIEYGHGGVQTDFPYQHYPRHFPGRNARLVAISPESQQILRQLNNDEIKPFGDKQLMALAMPAHQLGGEPWLVQPWECFEMVCPSCRRLMQFLASVGDTCLLPQGFVDNNYVQMCFSLCSVCKIICAVVQCD